MSDFISAEFPVGGLRRVVCHVFMSFDENDSMIIYVSKLNKFTHYGNRVLCKNITFYYRSLFYFFKTC